MSLSFPPMLSCPPSSNLLSSSNGLLCFSIPRSSSFIICNLLSQSLRRVKFPTCPFDFEMLTLVSTPNGYKLFMLSSMGSSTNTLVYDSKVSSWLQFDGFDLILNENPHQKGVYYDGCLFFTTPEPFYIACFNLESGKVGETDNRLAGRANFRPVGERRGPEAVLDWRSWSEWDFKKYEIVGVGGRWWRLGGG
ncbi:UNVERIFIED_CONTAM: F-box/kelch-repeat protein [Sesamum latifolium]|uniref:F-box/kelch-repeat protein n=1 Tax=Sesamum latifolium TaxID=2727402 RepID=A0AAW2WEM2_9LAMI